MKHRLALLTLTLLLASCNPLADFDAPSKANEIVLELGATRGGFGCDYLDDITGDSSGVCATHGMNPGDARDRVNGLMRWSGAKANGDWEASEGGYVRSYKYGSTDTFLVAINAQALIISY